MKLYTKLKNIVKVIDLCEELVFGNILLELSVIFGDIVIATWWP